MLALVDGNTTIARIIQLSGTNADSAQRLFARMHEWDHLMYQIPVWPC